RVFAATVTGVFKSLDGGESWTATDAGPTSVQELELSRQGLVTLYAASRRSGIASVHKTSDGGATWTATGPAAAFGLESLAIDPTNSSTLYVGSSIGRVFRSSDGGETWSRRDDGLEGAEIVYALAATPTKVLAGTLNGLFETIDGGASWNLVTRRFIAQTLAVDPVSPDAMYAGTFFQGVQRSLDGGATWSEFNTGLTHQRIEKLAIDSSSSRRIYAATPGSGVFFRDTNPSCTDDPTVLCLHDERFHVTVDWKTEALHGPARTVPFGTSDSGLFYFFDDQNWELLVKVLDGCGFNHRYWGVLRRHHRCRVHPDGDRPVHRRERELLQSRWYPGSRDHRRRRTGERLSRQSGRQQDSRTRGERDRQLRRADPCRRFGEDGVCAERHRGVRRGRRTISRRGRVARLRRE
ncbi:MAG: hypothetical protein MPN21_26585, partial [Thermoanaerobaculia bacterium]|nr:hypothetical protein [Thermoanaerobaculia bacterium]